MGGGLQSKIESKTVGFDNAGETVQGAGDGDESGRKRKPVVPFHGKVDAKHLTHKQKRQLKKRQANDSVVEGPARNELKTAAQMQKPHLRKERARLAKDARRKLLEERQMKNGAR